MSLLTRKKIVSKSMLRLCIGSASAVIMVSLWMMLWDVLGVWK